MNRAGHKDMRWYRGRGLCADLSAVSGRAMPSVPVTGSSLVPIVVPIVTTPILFLWLFAVFYADRHPEHGSHNRSSISLGPERSSAHGVEDRQRGGDALGLGAHTGEPRVVRSHQAAESTDPPPAG